jgi:tetratricopeptide (TPR) repeat protein
MPRDLIQVDVRKLPVRIVTVLIFLVAIVWGWFVVRWYVGNTLAEYLNPDENTLQTARLAVKLAPNDPLAHWRLGQVSQKKLPVDQLDEAIKEYETAVRLSPNDYRFWMSLGAALEEQGDYQRAEMALRRSVELAPSYSYPAWYLGNLFLRSGRYAEAFTELRRASQSDPELRPQLFNLASEIYKSDVEMMKTAVGPAAEVRAQFSLYLLGRNNYEDALRFWNSLNENEKKANRETGKAIVLALINAKRFHDSIPIWNDLSPSITYRVEEGKLLDGGFESDLARSADGSFGWQIKTVPQLQVGLDSNRQHSGSRSLRLLFQVPVRLDEIKVSQLVPVQPDTEYDLEAYVRTDNLNTASPPFIQIIDAVDQSVLAATAEAPSGANDWQRVSCSFKTKPKSEAVILRIARGPCGEDGSCPAFGIVWYDDFNLTRRN